MIRRHKRNYKFTEKTQSKRGVCALLLALLSVGVLAGVITASFWSRGDGSIYLGCMGVIALVVALLSFLLALSSLGEENSYKLFPYLSTFVSFLISGAWVALYVVGFYGY